MDRKWHVFYDKDVPNTISEPILLPNELFIRNSGDHPDDPFLIYDDKELSYAQSNRLSCRIANALSSLGVGKQDRVTLMMPNIHQYTLTLLACYKIGAIAVPTNPQFTTYELTNQFKDSGTRTVVVMAGFADKVLKIRESGTTDVNTIIIVPDPGIEFIDAPSPGVVSFDTIIEQSFEQEPEVNIMHQDIAVLQYSGGTTGIPKGCIIKQDNMAVAAKQVGIWFGSSILPRQVRTLAAIPLYHSYGRACNIDLALYTAGSIVLVTEPTTDNIIEAINKHMPNIMATVPAMIHGLTYHEDIGKSKIKLLKEVLCAGSALTLEILRKFEEIAEAPVIEGFGLSEVPYGIAFNPVKGLRKQGSIGVPMPSVDIKIVDTETGTEDLQAGESGEMIFKTYLEVAGYWNNREETDAMLKDGWLYTGDIGYMDKDGYIFIVDRKKDVIISSGFNVYPREVDEVLYSNPKILEACTIGVPDEKRGETVKSYVIIKSGENASEEELINYCLERITPYKVPTIVEFIEELPRTSLGKPDRKALREMDEAKRK